LDKIKNSEAYCFYRQEHFWKALLNLIGAGVGMCLGFVGGSLLGLDIPSLFNELQELELN